VRNIHRNYEDFVRMGLRVKSFARICGKMSGRSRPEFVMRIRRFHGPEFAERGVCSTTY
jgi:hypothetical protein